MIEYIEGDIFDSPAQVIVNTVNTVGVMGKGLALSFKNRYPDMFERYKRVCEEGKLQIGNLMLFYYPDHWLMLFPDKRKLAQSIKARIYRKGTAKVRQHIRGQADQFHRIPEDCRIAETAISKLEAM